MSFMAYPLSKQHLEQGAPVNLDRDQRVGSSWPVQRQMHQIQQGLTRQRSSGQPEGPALPLARLGAYDREVVERTAGMRLLFGMIIGTLLTIGGVYVADSRTDPLQGSRMVNWDVVGQRVSDLTADLRKVWADFTRQITGPP